MPLDEPAWWYAEGGLAPRLLAPAAELYGSVVEHRFRNAKPYRAPLPIICVGNFTAGGTGKTPLTRFLIGAIAARGKSAVCVTRGYGGSARGPVWVDRGRHGAADVGDEPLLIASDARVMVARDRKAGVAAIERDGAADAVIMDDGLQNPSLTKDLTIAVVDARRGIGNGHVIPAGPLRARLGFQLGLVDCIVVMGADAPDAPATIFETLKKRFHGPVLRGAVEPGGDVSWIQGASILAYAGIANPERFFATVQRFAPARLERRVFADHHPFTPAEAQRLLDAANAAGATLLTTEKDLARLLGTKEACADLAARSKTLPITVTFEERDLLRLNALIDGALKLPRTAVE